MPEACDYIKKEILAQVFSCDYLRNFEEELFYRTPPVAASELSSKF